MRTILIRKNYIIRDTVPQELTESYWLIDKRNNEKIAMIKKNNDNFEILNTPISKTKSLDGFKTSENNSNLLTKNSIHLIQLNKISETCLLFCLPDFDNSFIHLDIIGSNEITIGTDSNNTIVYNNPLLESTHAKLYKKKDQWILEDYNSKYGTFVNDFNIGKIKKHIFNGDIIFILGLEIILINNSIYINDPQESITLNNNILKISKVKNTKYIDSASESNTNSITINNNINYYSKSPRMIPPIKKEQIIIDPPPELVENRQRPLLLTVGSSIAMGLMMLTSLTATIQGMSNDNVSIVETIVGFIASFAMFISMLLFPILEVQWDKKSNKKYEQKRQHKYRQYLEKKAYTINKIKEKQKIILYKNYLSPKECLEVLSTDNHRLWERKPNDNDFLSVRIGIGKVPLQIDLKYPQEKFAMVDDNLLTELKKIINNSKYIANSPITLSLSDQTSTALVCEDPDFSIKYIKNIILQLVTFHSYDDLKLVFLLDNQNSNDWNFVKMLPYIWDSSNKIRFFADNYDDMNEISKFLIEEYSNRKNSSNTSSNPAYPHYLIITNNYRKIENLSIIQSLSKSEKNMGFSIFCISEDIYSLPSNCQSFIGIKNSKNGILFSDGSDLSTQEKITIEPLVTSYFEKISQKLFNIPVMQKRGASSLPNNYNFLQMYDVGNIDQLNILNRWNKNDSTLSLKAPIGIDSNGVLINLDIHENFHGPHGLIAGSTGSGKSEFIITYILSLAINYHPDDVNFLLIDYKGGGLSGAFQNNEKSLPHLVGTITNIEKDGLKRSLTSIQSELRRRQIVFNEARNVTNESTIDIYKYQKLYHDGIVEKPIAHLFIICDEFAELKQQQPEFMDELVSVSRIGRSLGVHLILATQKPNGIVDDQIRSNSKFGVCLKVQDTSDSQDVISKPDAAYLTNPGQFYLKVGQNEFFVLGQSGWAGAPYIPSTKPVEKIDSSVEFISNTGYTIKKVDEAIHNSQKNNEEQLTSILNYICDLANKENIKEQQLWLENIPSDIYIDKLRQKYNIIKNDNTIETIIGEYDDPSNQKQGLVMLNLNKGDNIIIYGNAKSGKETLLSTLAYDLMTNYNPSQINMYMLDFGTEALKIFAKSPNVGDIIFLGEDEKLDTFFDMIQRIIKERKETLSNYSGDYTLYLSKGNKMPLITIFLNNYEVFNENYEDKYDDLFLTITREGSKCGIMFIVTASSPSAMRFRLTSNFNKKIALQLNDSDDYYSIFDNIKDKRPSHIFGRGLFSLENNVYEFQTAKICESNIYNEQITEKIEELNDKYQEKAISIPTIPKVITLEDILPHISKTSSVPIGLIKKNLDIYNYNFNKNFVTVISSNDIDNAILFSSFLQNALTKIPNVKCFVLNSNECDDNLKKAYNNFQKEVKNSLKDKDDSSYYIYTIIGIEAFITENALDEFKFSELLKKAKNNNNHSFIIIENPDFLEGHTYDDWYTNYINSNSGIWIGNNVENQTLISTNFSMDNLDNNCGSSFGYVIDEGVPTLVKYIGLEERED